jgi:hypothetical protein
MTQADGTPIALFIPLFYLKDSFVIILQQLSALFRMQYVEQKEINFGENDTDSNYIQ